MVPYTHHGYSFRYYGNVPQQENGDYLGLDRTCLGLQRSPRSFRKDVPKQLLPALGMGTDLLYSDLKYEPLYQLAIRGPQLAAHVAVHDTVDGKNIA